MYKNNNAQVKIIGEARKLIIEINNLLTMLATDPDNTKLRESLSKGVKALQLISECYGNDTLISSAKNMVNANNEAVASLHSECKCKGEVALLHDYFSGQQDNNVSDSATVTAHLSRKSEREPD